MGPASSPGTGSAGTNTTCLQQWANCRNRYRLDRNRLPGDRKKGLQSALFSIRGRNLFCKGVIGRVNPQISHDFKNDSLDLKVLTL
jgi:hypothetical protein